MSRIEETLRGTLREQVAAPPVVDAIANRAISGATRIRRRRQALTGLASALSVLLVGTGIASYLTSSGQAPADPTAAVSATWRPIEPSSELPADVLVDRYIYEAGGGVRSLVPVVPESCDGGACISGVWRVRDGFLVAVFDSGAVVGGSVLWRLPDSGRPSVVVDGDGALVVSAGTAARPGVQVVWADDGRLHVGAYGDGRVIDVVSTPAPQVPVGETGEHLLVPWRVVGDAVVLSGRAAGTDTETWDVWFPHRGDYVPAVYPVIGPHGVTGDGQRIIGWYRPAGDEQDRCLGELVPEEFRPVRSLCPSPFSPDARISASPDGRLWMVFDRFRVGATDDVELGLALYDSEAFWSGAGPIYTWPDVGPSLSGTWLDKEAFAVVDAIAGTVVTVHADGRSQEPITLSTPGPAAQVSAVAVLQ